MAYSCDTEPTPAIARLAHHAKILVHESTGAYRGHSSPEQAAEIAAQAHVGRLLLVHLPQGLTDGDLAEARATFAATELGEELGAYAF